jgi:hypothetical protein
MTRLHNEPDEYLRKIYQYQYKRFRGEPQQRLTSLLHPKRPIWADFLDRRLQDRTSLEDQRFI